MPTAWWLRPVSRHARLGEHSAVVWKFGFPDRPDGRSSGSDQTAETRTVGEAGVVEQDEDDVRGVFGTATPVPATKDWIWRPSAQRSDRREQNVKPFAGIT